MASKTKEIQQDIFITFCPAYEFYALYLAKCSLQRLKLNPK
jgi:hypothetical protein